MASSEVAANSLRTLTGCPVNSVRLTLTATTSQAYDLVTMNRFIRFASDVDCYVKLGTATGTAANTDMYIPAKTVERIPCGKNTWLMVFPAASGFATLTEYVAAYEQTPDPLPGKYEYMR